MQKHQLLFQELLLSNFDETLFLRYTGSLLASVSAEDLALLFVNSAFLSSSMDFLLEEHWLQARQSEHGTDLQKVLQKLLQLELSHFNFLLSLANFETLGDAKYARRRSRIIEQTTLDEIRGRAPAQQKEFCTEALKNMQNLFSMENNLQRLKKHQGQHLGLSLYRSFDGLDQVFALNYEADHDMKSASSQQERLYEGAGVGVQSSYATVLNAVQELHIPRKAKVIDLGSGYGRVGLVLGLLRPDISFIGYEYVPHRVAIANASSKNLGLQPNVQFLTQDLSLKEFEIPVADIYYLYDPFSESTYGHVLGQLVAIARTKNILIVTKGNARGWLLNVVTSQGWDLPSEFDGGNLCIFSSAKKGGVDFA